jgi:hypothetical protein
MNNKILTEPIKKKISIFGILPEFIDNYGENIENGKTFLKDKKLAITGLIRNKADCIYTNISSINKELSQHANKLSYFVYENDSKDSTPDELARLKKDIEDFHFVSEKLNLKQYGQTKEVLRTTALAKHRNTCLNFIKTNFIDYDYVIVMDFDFLKISADGILNSFGHISKNSFIHAVAGNSFELKTNPQNKDSKYLWNYDSWAFRMNYWDDLHKHIGFFASDPMLWFGYWQPPIGSSLIKVNSAFGGSCIYNYTKYIGATYSGDDCEHVTFHKNLSEISDFNLYLNPSQIMLFI